MGVKVKVKAKAREEEEKEKAKAKEEEEKEKATEKEMVNCPGLCIFSGRRCPPCLLVHNTSFSFFVLPSSLLRLFINSFTYPYPLDSLP